MASYQVEPLTLLYIFIAYPPSLKGMLNKNYHQIIPILTHSESPLKEYTFVTNPLVFTAYKDQLPDA